MPKIVFYIMSLFLRCRDLIRPRYRILDEVDIKPGNHVLDFGCGHGSYTFIVSESVGDEGIIYAQEILQLPLDIIVKEASKLKLENITTICSDCSTGLPDESIDVVLLYDVFHLLRYPGAVLEELHRVLSPDGVLSFSDHHMSDMKIRSGVTQNNIFKLSERGKYTYGFRKC
jgi:ubiquinone/menaquinone biosynthesis C-methylase UbiE